MIAGILAAAAAASIPSQFEFALSDRGRGHSWGDRLALGRDERVEGLVWFDLDQSIDEAGLAAHRAVLRSRRSGHRVFPSLGTPPVGELSGLITAIERTLPPGITAHMVTHRPCTTSDGVLYPGCFEIAADGSQLLREGSGPTEDLQRAHDSAGWFAVDYGSALATLLITAEASEIERDLASFVAATADAALVVHAASLEAAFVGLTTRIHNGITARTVVALTGRESLLPLFQIIIGMPRADGTISVDIVDEPLLVPGLSRAANHNADREMSADG